MEMTLSIIKPDAVARNIIGKINDIIETSGLKIIAQKMVNMPTHLAEAFYHEHEEKPWFQEVIDMITSGPIVVQILEGDDAVARYRKIMGATDPHIAKSGTIRKMFGIDKSQNSVHGSDSLESAHREIDLLFQHHEICR